MSHGRWALVAALLAVTGVGACAPLDRVSMPWREARRDASGQVPDAEATPQAVVQVYGARAVGWRGLFAVHTWIAIKRERATTWRRYEVIGWGVGRGLPSVRIDRGGPDDYWFGARPDLLADARGDDALIDRVEAAIQDYPYPRFYRTWPGPNSNTFTAHIARAVPELRLRLPPTAVGKDFVPYGLPLAPTPAGRGMQVSIFGVAGVLAGWDEGVEINVLGLTFGVDPRGPALLMPIAGRVGR